MITKVMLTKAILQQHHADNNSNAQAWAWVSSNSNTGVKAGITAIALGEQIRDCYIKNKKHDCDFNKTRGKLTKRDSVRSKSQRYSAMHHCRALTHWSRVTLIDWFQTREGWQPWHCTCLSACFTDCWAVTQWGLLSDSPPHLSPTHLQHRQRLSKQIIALKT